MAAASAPPGTQFTALKDFFSKELGSQYTAELSYTVRESDTKLAELVPVWVKEGKVRLGGTPAKVEGRG
jgi:hypothetical protein